MRRINGLETGFLLRENATQNSNTGCLMRLHLDDPACPIELDALRAHVVSRLDLVPSLRQRVVDVPLRLHRSMLADDPEFDIDRHLEALTLQAPGDEVALNAAFAEATRHAFERDHALWRMTLVNGLGGGDQAIFFIFNHVLMDGVGYISTLNGLCTDVPPPRPPYARPFRPERPSRARLMGRALIDQVLQLSKLPRLVLDTHRGRRAMAARIAQTSRDVPPPSPTRSALSPGYRPSLDRRFATADLSFDDVRAVRKAADVTINTVLLALVAISLRRYLLERGQLPGAALVTGVMASTEPLEAPPRQDGNLFANFVVSLGTDLDDPWGLMHTIAAATAEGKHRLELLGIDIQNRWLEMIPPAIWVRLIRRQDARRNANPEVVRTSTLFSNVRGAPGYHFLGATVRGLYTYGPIADGVGNFISSTNLGDTFHLVVISNPTAIERPDELADSFRVTLAELVSLADARGPSSTEIN